MNHQLATRLVASRSAEDPPRIFTMTAAAMQGDRELCSTAGMDDDPTKPIGVDQRVDALLRTLPREDVRMPEPIIDSATFTALGEMAGAEFVGELVDTFLEEAPRILAELHAAYAKRDAESFRRAAHSLKSNSNTFGALQLGRVAKTLELEGLDATSPTQLDALDAEYARASSALKALRDG